MQLLRAHAKVNLTLDVLGRRPDGYHNISSVMQTLALADDIRLELIDRGGEIDLTVEGPFASGAPLGSDNLVYRAASAVLARADHRLGARIALTKNIPAQAGLGGGSSDAAATLRALNSLLGKPLTPGETIDLGRSLGADVPFFLTGGTCLVEGVGERVSRLPATDLDNVVIVKPDIGVSTAAAYAALDAARADRASSGPRGWDGKTLRNDFEEVVFAAYPETRGVRDRLLAAGCAQALLCGSGSAVFGTVSSPEEGERIAREMESVATFRVFLTSAMGESL